MVWNEDIKIVWDEDGTCHAVRGKEISEDEQFVRIRLIDGTELNIAKSRIIKIERFSEGVR